TGSVARPLGLHHANTPAAQSSEKVDPRSLICCPSLFARCTPCSCDTACTRLATALSSAEYKSWRWDGQPTGRSLDLRIKRGTSAEATDSTEPNGRLNHPSSCEAGAGSDSRDLIWWLADDKCRRAWSVYVRTVWIGQWGNRERKHSWRSWSATFPPRSGVRHRPE